MIDLIREWFELLAKQSWLKHIDRAVNQYNRLNQKANVQAHVVHKLVERYNEIYGKEIAVEARDGQKGGSDEKLHRDQVRPR